MDHWEASSSSYWLEKGGGKEEEEEALKPALFNRGGAGWTDERRRGKGRNRPALVLFVAMTREIHFAVHNEQRGEGGRRREKRGRKNSFL